MANPTNKKGFTIIEVLVVILLISLLAAFIVPQYIGKAEAAKPKIAKAGIAMLELHLSAFMLDCGRYPQPSEWPTALRSPPPGLVEKWKGPYGKESHLLDPWSHPYQYVLPGKKNPQGFDIVSYGADGKPGGEAENADIYND